MPPTPVAPNPSSSAKNGDFKSTARQTLLSLDARRQALEMEASAIIDELTREPEDGGIPMGIDTPLVDHDGYPRSDIDVYRARTLRKRLKEIKTDRASLMEQLEVGLVKVAAEEKRISQEEEQAELNARLAPKPKPKFDPVTGKWVVKNWDGTLAGVKHGEKRSFDNLSQNDTNATNLANTLAEMTTTNTADNTTPTPPLVPFAVVDALVPSSPAAEAGLKEQDLIAKFGSANHLNHRNLMAIAEMVPLAAGEQQQIPITVLRRRNVDHRADVQHGVEVGVREKVELRLLPKPWGGRGLLGCHIKVYTDSHDYLEPH
mmetsp:Transcript_39748/g.59735  ORF Transcript_39748/g.59735 Transcript_39748/m.59735 type:complete len:317 (+) Transcript_39748:135-1085(+)